MHKIRILLLIGLMAAVSLAGWEGLDPVGGDMEEEVWDGGCAARGRGVTFVAIGGDEDGVYPFVHQTETWYEDFEAMPGCIECAGAMAYEKQHNGRLFVATDEDNHLQVYYFNQPIGLEGHWHDPDLVAPIALPELIEPGVALAFQPVENPASLLSGYLYLLPGGSTRLWRRAFALVYGAPDGLGPEDGATVSVYDLDFDWRQSPQWTAYRIQVAPTPAFDEPVIDTVVTDGEFRPPQGRMPADRTYYWRVCGQYRGRASSWSETRRFHLTGDRQPKVYRRFPPDGFTVAEDVAFDWTSVTGAGCYQLQVTDNPLFTDPVVDVKSEVSEYCPVGMLKTGKWFWRTRWQAGSGEWSEWSEVGSFALEYGWVSLPNKPGAMVTAGGAMCHVIGRDNVAALYVLTGGNSREFWRFNLDPGVWAWEARGITPRLQNGGASLTSYDVWSSSNVLRAIMGGNTGLWRYTIADNTWGQTPEPLPRACGLGSSIVRDETDYELVLTIAGEYDPPPTNFYKWVEDPGDGDGPLSQSQASPVAGAWYVREGAGREARFGLSLDRPGRTSVAVFDPAGRRVQDLLDSDLPAGAHHLTWNLTDQQGRRVRAGVYLVAVDSPDGRTTLKVPVW